MQNFQNFKFQHIPDFLKSISPLHFKFLGAIATFALIRKYFNGPKNYEFRSLDKQIAIITGASAGLGKETARDLLKSGAIVIFACRNEEKTLAVIKSITDEKTIKNAIYMNLDLTLFSSVEKFVKEFSKKFDKVDLLINNAGQFTDSLQFTKDGNEMTMQTNHCSHFLLTGLLLKFLKNSEDPRVINVSSMAHERVNDSLSREFNKQNYSGIMVYGITKAANIIFSENLKEFCGKKTDGTNNIKTASLHPGVVRTEFARFFDRGFLFKICIAVMTPFSLMFSKDEKMGAQTQIHLCHVAKDAFKNGEYYSDCAVKKKNEIIRKYDLEKNINKYTCEAILRSDCYNNIKDEPEFMEYFDFFKTKY